MAWERRGNKKFYYRSRKVNGRVVREYIGRGERAKRVAQEDAEKREAREKERAVRRQFQALDAQLKDLTTAATTMVKATLLVAGYHEHKRQWRKRRMNNINDEGQHFMKDDTLTLEAETATYDNMEALVQKAQQGDMTTLPVIRELLDRVPQVWEGSRIFAGQIERSWLETISGRDLISQEILEREVQALREQLRGPNPSSLEALLVDRICTCWLAVQHAELIASKPDFDTC